MQCAICGSNASFVCGKSGRPVCPEHARVEVVSRLSFGSSGSLSVREAGRDDYERIGQLAEYFWNKTRIIRFGKEYDVLKLPAYVSSTNAHISGVVSYAVEPDSVVLVGIDVLPGYQGLGAGRMLVDALKTRAAGEKKSELRVAVANDDLPGIYFYQKNGFRIYEVKPSLLAEHNEDVQVGFAGIPIRDEIRLHCLI